MTVIADQQIADADQLAPAVPSELMFRLTVGKYHEMIRTGILAEDDPVELLEGWLIFKMSKNPPHRIATRLLSRALDAIVPAGWYVDSQEPITTDTSEPEPDVAVIRGNTRDYADRHPGPENVTFIAEIAESSLARDRGIKRRVYAQAKVPVYWVVDIVQRQVEVFTNPTGTADEPVYGDVRKYGESDSIAVIIDGREVGRIDVVSILA